ncbi:hypothetical protein [Inquilinus sp.]|uniref:hypothetical protein n=1 Tax=Inquilinus sp. TaxID=1932117 RepID=UPI0031DBA0B1
MSLTVTYKDNKLSLVGKDGRIHEVNAAQQQQWMQTLDGLAKQHQLKDAKELLSQGTVEVPEAGDSQWRMAMEAGIAPENIDATVVALNDQIANPDLIQTYHEGDLKPDFVMLPVAPEQEPIPGSDAPAGMPAPTPGNTKPPEFATTLANETDPKKRDGLVDGYFKAADDPKKAVQELLGQDFGNDADAIRRKIVHAYLDKVAGGNGDNQLKTLKDLAEFDWKNGKGESVDVSVDTQILAVAKELGFKKDQIPNLNAGVKD